ncbi:SDR family NAD(P)-dependent oxidoreductase [Collimonas pratensis]|uniref:Short chain dehydrogenase family protein n=1 Tax=Collimonas pratensis TaxID=279113 RepID=A0A127Q7G8_9BURK|nr:SDR family NAD(P)-dependent oxidoreductase [Collimonas pratensis]AMP05974.1 short chain dehydrogenase family protein [Collimonas pratensis]
MFSAMNIPIRDWRQQRIWFIGASSGIGAALARYALSAGADVIISARRVERLHQVAAAHPSAHVVPLDVLDVDAWSVAYRHILDQIGTIDLIVFCAANYRPERSWEVDPVVAESTLRINLGSIYTGLATILPDMLSRGHGGIALIASIAGYMGLPNASVYGPSKAALINLSEILYSDLHPKGLNVYLINPGFVKSELTDKNTFPMPGLQTPEQAAHVIWAGISAGRFEIHFPRRVTQVMKLLQLLPYRLRFALFTRFLKIS